MRIGIIGVGNVGGTLAKKLASKGHVVFLGTRKETDGELLELARSMGAQAQVCSVLKAIEQSEVILLATPWDAVTSILADYGHSLKNKILVDCTNPLKPDLSGLLLSGDRSGGEYIQSALRESFVIKAFNSVGFNIMENPVIEGRKAAMYFCGDDSKAKFIVQGLVSDVGFEALDAGGITNSRLLESFALLWISTAYRFGIGREFAFGILRK